LTAHQVIAVYYDPYDRYDLLFSCGPEVPACTTAKRCCDESRFVGVDDRNIHSRRDE